MAQGVMKLLVDISVDTTKSFSVEIPSWARYAKLYVPALDANGIVSCEAYTPNNAVTAAAALPSADTNWKAVLDSAESNQIVGSGTEQRWVDVSEYIRGFPAGTLWRVVCAGVQVSDVTFLISFGR
jgi:hypothetical protein